MQGAIFNAWCRIQHPDPSVASRASTPSVHSNAGAPWDGLQAASCGVEGVDVGNVGAKSPRVSPRKALGSGRPSLVKSAASAAAANPPRLQSRRGSRCSPRARVFFLTKASFSLECSNTAPSPPAAPVGPVSGVLPQSEAPRRCRRCSPAGAGRTGAGTARWCRAVLVPVWGPCWSCWSHPCPPAPPPHPPGLRSIPRHAAHPEVGENGPRSGGCWLAVRILQ